MSDAAARRGSVVLCVELKIDTGDGLRMPARVDAWGGLCYDSHRDN